MIPMCETRNNRLRPCFSLASRIGKSGLHPMDTLDESGVPRVVRRGVLHGKGKDSTVLNFCPWCGTDLRPAFESLRAVEEP